MEKITVHYLDGSAKEVKLPKEHIPNVGHLFWVDHDQKRIVSKKYTEDGKIHIKLIE